ncbi:MAG: hypothetical protein A2X59_00090 [Nitrospirae bacterium GWC2_42_7]|nr:MAG: hypothetical protein A2X59_00090 [Nitrospirae bacterium GWC2_42_7]
MKRREILKGLVAAGIAMCIPRISFGHPESEIPTGNKNDWQQDIAQKFKEINTEAKFSLIGASQEDMNTILGFRGLRDIGYGAGCPSVAVNKAISSLCMGPASIKKAKGILVSLMVGCDATLDVVRDTMWPVIDYFNEELQFYFESRNDSSLSPGEVRLVIIATGIEGTFANRVLGRSA